MQPPLKYQPYRGYHRKPWLAYDWPGYGHRIRTRGDWRWEKRPRNHAAHVWYPSSHLHIVQCVRCGTDHCRICGCYQPWKRWDKDAAASNYEKRLAHRTFRHEARSAIRAELNFTDPAAVDISHTFRYCGTWLD